MITTVILASSKIYNKIIENSKFSEYGIVGILVGTTMKCNNYKKESPINKLKDAREFSIKEKYRTLIKELI